MVSSNINKSIFCLLLDIFWINSQFAPQTTISYLQAYYDNETKIDYTDEDIVRNECLIRTSCDISDICDSENQCEFCSDDQFPKIQFVISELDCSKMITGSLNEQGNIDKISNISVDNGLYMLVYANKYFTKGVVKRNGNNYLESNPKNIQYIYISGESVVAGYNPDNDRWYYILRNQLMTKNSTGEMQVRLLSGPLGNAKILAADIDFLDQSGQKIYIAVLNYNNIEIYRTEMYLPPDIGPHPQKIALLPFNSSASFDYTILKIQKSIFLYISSGHYIIQINIEYPTIVFCDVFCTVRSFAVDKDNKVYFSCNLWKNISRMEDFCKVHPFSDNIFPKAPLIVQISDILDTQHPRRTTLATDEYDEETHPDIFDAQPPSRTTLATDEYDEETHPGLPPWFPYVVGGGAALILLILIVIIACICYKFRMAKRNTPSPPIPPGFTGLSYNNKEVDDNLYLDLETFELTPKTKKKAAPTLPAIRTEAVYADLIDPATATGRNHGNTISEPDYDNLENTKNDKIYKK